MIATIYFRGSFRVYPTFFVESPDYFSHVVKVPMVVCIMHETKFIFLYPGSCLLTFDVGTKPIAEIQWSIVVSCALRVCITQRDHDFQMIRGDILLNSKIAPKKTDAGIFALKSIRNMNYLERTHPFHELCCLLP